MPHAATAISSKHQNHTSPPPLPPQRSKSRETAISDEQRPGALGPDAVEGTRSGVPRFTLETLKRDALAGVVTGLMAIPLTVGICLVSEFPVQKGLATVVVACLISFIAYMFRPGNHVGVPGVAAGLAPLLAEGVHAFGMENMPWVIFLAAVMQAVVWKFELAQYILKAVPAFLIEGLLAGVGLTILMKFLPYTYVPDGNSVTFWSADRIVLIFSSLVALGLFVYLYQRFKDTKPGIPYIAVIAGSIWVALYFKYPMLHVEPVSFQFAWPWADVASIKPSMYLDMLRFASILMLVDVIEQVMSNAAIQQIDPYGRKSNSSNSLLVMWLGNMAASLFGGMTNLDGLAKSSTNRMAGAVTKVAALFVAGVLSIVLVFPGLLSWMPEFSLGVLMVFTGWRMIMGLYHVAQHGSYEFGLSMFCGVLVFELGLFEGLMYALAIHSFIVYVIFKHSDVPTLDIFRKVVLIFTEGPHPHTTETMEVVEDASGGVVYRSVSRAATEKKDLDDFIQDWAQGVNFHNVSTVVSTYDGQGLLWGTFAKDLRAGHFHIRRYFEHLFELDGVRVEFESGETRQYHDIFIRSGSYKFTYFQKGRVVQVPARYSFVCKKERTGWYILEHHSSEFPQ
jgi:MFS superfamily sulfate permease-like transporter